MKKDGIIGTLFSAILHIGVIVAAVYFIYKGAGMCYDYGYRIFQEPPMAISGAGRTVSVTIPGDVTVRKLATMLESKGLVRDSKLTMLQFFCSEYRKDIKAGTYDLNTAMTAEEMFAVMAGGTWEEKEDDN